MNSHLESTNQYQLALKAGRKAYRQSIQQGEYPFLQVLDEIIGEGMAAGEINLGLIEIPTDRIIGTKSRGRTNAFASNFMPLLSVDSEFGMKWCSLCEAHLSDEGIREPVICYEFLGRFYVLEGNKRVSVMKHFGATSISSQVIRILPGESDHFEVRAYREFLSSYPLTKLYQVSFTRPGSFPKLQIALGYEPDHVWTDIERRSFLSGYYYFEKAFNRLGGKALAATVADALLEWLKVYPFDSVKTLSSTELIKALEAIWADIKIIGVNNAIEVTTEAPQTEKPPKVLRSLGVLNPILDVAFIHEFSPESSNWVKAHDLGSIQLEQALGNHIRVQRFMGVGKGDEAVKAMETAIENGAELIFTTTASLISACRKTAARHPEAKILNCSIAMPYTDVRSYYSRIYEGKFISGAIAGAISKSDRIGYIASYPIFGVPAGINAFALGAQLTNPNAKVHLKWYCTEGDPLDELSREGIDIVSTLDIPLPGYKDGRWGTFRIEGDGSTRLIASPYWDWGPFYIQIVRSVLAGEWDSPAFMKRKGHPVNYWWGMSSGVIGVQWTEALPIGTRMLADILKQGIIKGEISPFRRIIVSQDGAVRNDGESALSPEAILNMDWLCENVVGSIPEYEDIVERSRSIVRLQGIYRDRIPPEKEGVII